MQLRKIHLFKSFDDVSFVFLVDIPNIDKNRYREFIKNYFGYIKVKYISNGIELQLFLHLEGERQLMAFQAMELSNGLFTKKLDDVYFNPNRTSILFEYKESIDFNKVIQENNLVTQKDIEENFYLFYARPNFKLRFITNTPNVDYYELKINENDIVKITKNTYDWNLDKGINKIKVCSVNKQGIKGSITEMKILYN